MVPLLSIIVAAPAATYYSRSVVVVLVVGKRKKGVAPLKLASATRSDLVVTVGYV